MYGPLSFVAIMATALNDRYESKSDGRDHRSSSVTIRQRAAMMIFAQNPSY
jgi:hypothetical protein